MSKKDPKPTPVGQTPPPKQGTGKPPRPRPNEIDLITLIDDHIESNKTRKGTLCFTSTD
jgi:hypothetical protein